MFDKMLTDATTASTRQRSDQPASNLAACPKGSRTAVNQRRVNFDRLVR
jgi:hypothetical protein